MSTHMPQWVQFAMISMVFAGLTAVIAKMGLQGISSELGLTIRTLFVAVFVLTFAAAVVPGAAFATLTLANWWGLGISGLTTALSWVFYYKALKEGDVATVALIDKGSVVVAIVLAAVLLKEAITLRVVAGAALVVAGLVLIARK